MDYIKTENAGLYFPQRHESNSGDSQPSTLNNDMILLDKPSRAFDIDYDLQSNKIQEVSHDLTSANQESIITIEDNESSIYPQDAQFKNEFNTYTVDAGQHQIAEHILPGIPQDLIGSNERLLDSINTGFLLLSSSHPFDVENSTQITDPHNVQLAYFEDYGLSSASSDDIVSPQYLLRLSSLNNDGIFSPAISTSQIILQNSQNEVKHSDIDDDEDHLQISAHETYRESSNYLRNEWLSAVTDQVSIQLIFSLASCYIVFIANGRDGRTIIIQVLGNLRGPFLALVIYIFDCCFLFDYFYYMLETTRESQEFNENYKQNRNQASIHVIATSCMVNELQQMVGFYSK